MTRLTSQNVLGLGERLESYDQDLIRKTGFSLLEISCHASGVRKEEIAELLNSLTVAVVPVTAGKGLIEGFTDAVRDIVCHVGVKANITVNSDVAGLGEAIESGTDVVFLADDFRFIAINLSQRRVVDNAYATAYGYAGALDCMMGGLSGSNVLVLGAGRVGSEAIQALQGFGARVAVFEPDKEKLESVVERYGVDVCSSLDEALRNFNIIFDATPAPDIIDSSHIKADTVIIAPGIPLALTADAYELVKERVIHDPLQLGVATMLVMSVV